MIIDVAHRTNIIGLIKLQSVKQEAAAVLL